MTTSDLEAAACAHRRVAWFTETVNGLTHGWWECSSKCGVKFWPAGAYDAMKTELGKIQRLLYEVSSTAESDRAEAYIMLKDNNEALGLKLLELEAERDEAQRQRGKLAAVLRDILELAASFAPLYGAGCVALAELDKVEAE